MKVYWDGAVEPFNPGGIASYGFVIKREEAVLAEGKGIAAPPGTAESTNNVAEYTALIKGLEAAGKHANKDEPIMVQGDSQLVVRQVNGTYAVKAPHLKPLHDKALFTLVGLVSAGHHVHLKWIPREENGHADRLSKEAIAEVWRSNPFALDGATLSFGMHKGKVWEDVPKDYRDWLVAKK